MEIIKININEINPYENNAKEHPKEQIEQIKQSILEFGNNDPIAIDEKNIIIAGHGRYKALKELGYEEVDVIKLEHLNEQQKAAYRLVHNQLTMNTDWDTEKLKEELKKIDINLYEFAFEESLLDELEEEYEEDFEDIPEDVELEKTKDDGEKISVNYLQFDGKKIALTEEELTKLNDKYEFYLEIHKTNFGFVNYLLGSENNEI